MKQIVLTKTEIVKVFEESFLNLPYKRISIKTLCDAANITKQVFFEYFTSKDQILGWIIERDFNKAIAPATKTSTGYVSAEIFFVYIKAKENFYTRAFHIDGGLILQKLLSTAYETMSDLSLQSARRSRLFPKVNPEVFFNFYHSGIAAVVIFWIKGEMKTPIEDVSRDLNLFLDNSMQAIRDNYLK